MLICWAKKILSNSNWIKGKKLNISVVFITQCYFAVPKNIRLNSAHYFVMKIPNKRDLQQIGFNHWSHIDFQDYESLKKVHWKIFFLVIDTTLASDNSSRFWKKFVETI